MTARETERRQFIGLFADGLADGLAVDRAAARLGKSASWGAAALREICRELGPQAA